jgi:hypothetical protein
MADDPGPRTGIIRQSDAVAAACKAAFGMAIDPGGAATPAVQPLWVKGSQPIFCAVA